MLVSVVICSHNREEYLSQAIDSVLAQKGDFSLEIIIGEDCSTDGSRALLAEYDKKYPGIFVMNYHQTNQGLGRNWASSVLLARGEYVAFCDDDDYWCDEWRLSEIVSCLEADRSFGFAYSAYYQLVEPSGKMILCGEEMPKDKNQVDVVNSHMGMFFGTCVIRRSLISEHICLQDYIDLNFSIQDWPTIMLLAPHTKFKWISTPSVVYRVYDGSMSRPKTYESVLEKYAREKEVVKYVEARKPEGVAFNERYWDSYVNHLLLAVAYKKNDFKSAKEFSSKVIKKGKMEIFAKTWLSFELFRILKAVKAKRN